jgi:hypothetical protein
MFVLICLRGDVQSGTVPDLQSAEPVALEMGLTHCCRLENGSVFTTGSTSLDQWMFVSVLMHSFESIRANLQKTAFNPVLLPSLRNTNQRVSDWLVDLELETKPHKIHIFSTIEQHVARMLF